MSNQKHLQLSLDQTWHHQLLMSKSIAEQKQNGSEESVHALKRRWCHENGFLQVELINNCFFCTRNANERACRGCPGSLVDLHFHCVSKGCDYAENPTKFYQRLLDLNQKRITLTKRTDSGSSSRKDSPPCINS